MIRPHPMFVLIALLPSVAAAGDEKQPAVAEVEVVRFDGKLLLADPPGNREQLERNLTKAMADLAEHPDDSDRLIWVGRRLGYLWRMNEAIEVFTEGIEKYPEDPRFLRHRGHRYISVRQFDNAIADLERAAKMVEGKPDEVEPDGQPNDQGVFLTTLQFNIWYHLGLARYLNGDYEGAIDAYDKAMRAGRKHDDNRVACTFWMVLAYRQLKQEDKADQLLVFVNAKLKIIENKTYLLCDLMFKGPTTIVELLSTPEARRNDPALGYAIAMEYLKRDARKSARAQLHHVLDGPSWPSFGYIAAEMELVRLEQNPE